LVRAANSRQRDPLADDLRSPPLRRGEVVDGNGRLAEEWMQTDYRSFLTKLGVTTTESTEQGRS
jgi:hypothetical protein